MIKSILQINDSNITDYVLNAIGGEAVLAIYDKGNKFDIAKDLQTTIKF